MNANVSIETVRIREARLADFAAVVSIYNGVIEEGGYTADTAPYSLDSRRDWFVSHLNARYALWVAETGRQIAGYGHLSAWRPDRAALFGVAEVSYYLAAPYRGRGIGRRLLSQGLEIAMRNGFHTVIAILLDTNVRSIGLLQSLEFEIWGRMPDIARFENGRCGQLILGRGL